MATSKAIQKQATGVFDDLELERIREIAGLKLTSEVVTLAEPLTAVQRQATRADILAFDDVDDGTVELSGGRDGLKYSQLKDKEEIRQRLRVRLGLDPIDPLFNPNAAKAVWIGGEGWQAQSTTGEF